MKLTKTHKLALIDIGLEALLDKTLKPRKYKIKIKSTKLHWSQTPAGKSKLTKIMEKRWRDKRKKNLL